MSRCRRKLAARFKMIHTSWRDPDLIALLRTWQPAPNEVITGYMDLSSPEYGLVVNTIRRWGVVDEEKRVQLGGGGAARFVGDCLASIVERLQDLIVSQMTPDDLTFVFGVLWILRVLLLHEKTKWLFTQTSLAYHVKPCTPCLLVHILICSTHHVRHTSAPSRPAACLRRTYRTTWRCRRIPGRGK